MVEFEKEVVTYLNIPSIPKKEWNQTDSFQCGVAVINLSLGRQAYAVCSFDKETDREPRITKVFGVEPFGSIDKVFVVPAYMDNNTVDADLDAESKNGFLTRFITKTKLWHGSNSITCATKSKKAKCPQTKKPLRCAFTTSI